MFALINHTQELLTAQQGYLLSGGPKYPGT